MEGESRYKQGKSAIPVHRELEYHDKLRQNWYATAGTNSTKPHKKTFSQLCILRLWSAPMLSLFLINVNIQSMISRCSASLKHQRELHRCSLNWDSIEKRPRTWPIVDIWLIECWWGLEYLLVLRENWVVIDWTLMKHWYTSIFSLVPTSHVAPNFLTQLCSFWITFMTF